MPDWLRYVREHLSLPDCSPKRQAEIVEELAEQLEDAYQEALRSGMNDEGAYLAASRHVPNWDRLADDLRRAGVHQGRRAEALPPKEPSALEPKRPSPSFASEPRANRAQKITIRERASVILSNALRDLHFALRMLARNPGFGFMAILTIAIGIGANTAIFSFVNSVLIRPLPYPNADRLAIILSGQGNADRAPVSTFELFHIREQAREFDQVAGIWVTNGTLPGEGDAEQVKRGVVTSNFLPLLCARPALGRFFGAEDEDRQHPRAIVLSHGVWARRFGSDPTIIGRSVRIGQGSAVVIGVLPANFRLIFPNDASVPTNVDFFDTIPIDASGSKGPSFLHLIGRLRRGSNLARAQAEANAVAAHLRSLDSEIALANFRLSVFSLHADDVREVRTTLLLLFGGVGFVLLIACANVANLVMAHAMHRIRETTIRAALGASRARLVGQLLTESLLLSCLGAAVALGIGWGAVRAILTARPPSLANFDVHLDLRVFAFTIAVAVCTSALFGLAPSLSVRRLQLTRGLKEACLPAGWRRGRWPSFLVSAEVALAFVLLLGTGLLIRTFVNILRADPGFRADNVSTFRISAPNFQALQHLQKNLSALPGVQSVSAVSHLPLDDTGNWYDYYWKEGAAAEQQNTVMADHRSILPGYFSTIGATLLEGRDFTESDDASHQRAVIVDDVLARELWPEGKAVGSKLNVSDSPAGPYQFQRDWAIVVGVVRHVQFHSLIAVVRPQIYVPYQVAPRPSMSIVIRTVGGDTSDLFAAARKQVALVNKDIAVTHLEPLSAVVMRAQAESRFASLLATLLSATALLLACVGIYGVLSYSVAQRTSEIGVRMAIGAGRLQVMKMVLADGMTPVLAGVAGGFLLSLIVTRLLTRLLFGVKPEDPVNYALILFIVIFVSVLAALLPARRAMKMDPLTALRCE